MSPRSDEDEGIGPDTRAHADGFKLALKELTEKDPEILKNLLTAIIKHLLEGTSRWAGGKLLAGIGSALLVAAIWLITKGYSLK